MRQALVRISTGLIENIVVVNPEDLPAAPDGCNYIDDDGTAQIGGTWDGVFHPKPPVDPVILDALADQKAQQKLDDAVHKVIAILMWDFEERLRGLGANSMLADISGAVDRPGYFTALKARVKAML